MSDENDLDDNGAHAEINDDIRCLKHNSVMKKMKSASIKRFK